MDYADTQLLLGQLYLRVNRVEDGRALLSKYKIAQALGEKAKHVGYLLSNRTNLPDAHFQMAQSYISMGDTAHAKLELHRTLELNPKQETAKRELVKLELAE